jgi:acetolactate synthase I/III small subunit
MRHVISVLVENKFGVLAKIAGLFSGRGFNIDSLCVGETMDPTISRMTIVTRGDDRILEQVNKQLNRLVDVIKVQDFTDKAFVDRELVLVKVKAPQQQRAQVLEVVDIFRAKIVDVNPETLSIEVTGDPGKIKAILDLLEPFGIEELVRTGRVAVARGALSLKEVED